MPPPSTSATQLQYFVLAHPDDEYASWSLIENSPANYKVFVVCTRGAQANACDNPAVDPGEDAPAPNPPGGKGSSGCKTARLNSFRNFLRYMNAIDPYVQDPGNADGTGPLPGASGYTIQSNTYCAALFCDYPDGGLTQANVRECISAARNERGNWIPSLPEYVIIGCWPYSHVDHNAVRDHLVSTAYSGIARWVTDPQKVLSNRRSDEIDLATHNHAFVSSPSATNIGAFQRAYGWLQTGYWAKTTYSRTQYHARYGP